MKTLIFRAVSKIRYFALLMVLTLIASHAWGTVTSGTAYAITSSSFPSNWTKSVDAEETKHLRLTSNTSYIQTEDLCQNGISSIVVKARTYGGTSGSGSSATNVCRIEWIDSDGTITVGTVTPTTTTLTNKTLNSADFTNTPNANKKGKLKFSFPNAASSKGGAIGEITITYTSGSCDASIKYTVTYDGNENTGGSVPTDATEYSSGATVTVKDNTGSLVKTGYNFGGWNTAADGTGTNYTAGTGTFSITANTTLYAKWTPISYTVTWKVDGTTYTTGTPTNSVNHGGKVTKLPTDPDPASYCGDKFMGWTTVENYDAGTAPSPLFTTAAGAPTVTSNVTYYAVFGYWE